jgi:hypothetical protein
VISQNLSASRIEPLRTNTGSKHAYMYVPLQQLYYHLIFVGCARQHRLAHVEGY